MVATKKAATKKKASKRQPPKSKLPLDRVGKKTSSSRSTKAKQAPSVKKKAAKARPTKQVSRKKPARTRYKKRQLSIRLGPNVTLEITLKNSRSKAKKSKSRRLSKKQLQLAHKRRQISAVAFVVFGVIGTVYFASNLFQSESPPPVVYSPPAPAEIAQTELERAAGLPASEPVHLQIPDADIDTSLITVGRNSDGTMEVPESFEVAGWYKYGPTPGEIGPSIIVGHVDSIAGPAVFWQLSQLKPGQLIEIKRTDGTLVTFAVTDSKQFEQDNFPTDEVYGNIDYAGLRLITCGGWFDRDVGRYSHNTVVYARLQE